MSYDPYSSYPDEPRSGEPYDDRFTQLPGDEERIKGRVQPAAIALIIIGILNLFFGLYMVLNTVIITMMPANQLKDQQMAISQAFPPAWREQAEQKTPEEAKTQVLVIYWPLTAFALLASAL